MFIVVGLSCADCMGEDGPDLIGIFNTKEEAVAAEDKWWGGTCGRTFVLEGDMSGQTRANQDEDR